MRPLVVVLLVVAGCGSGPGAPPIGDTDVACADPFCVEYPAGWEVETGRDFLTFTHPAAPEAAATVGHLNPEAVVVNAGVAWPAPTETVVRSFWSLLEAAEVASFESMVRLTGGSFRSTGSYEGGRLWHLLVPGESDRAIAVEVRGPNRSWESHADVFFGAVLGQP